MERISRPAFVLFVSLFALSAPLFALEVGVYGDVSNMDFRRDRNVTATNLPGDTYMWGIAVSASQPLTDQISLEVGFESDPVLRNVGSTLISYTGSFVTLAVGPFFGILNAPGSIARSGLSTTVRLFVPGVTVLTLRSGTTFGSRLAEPGDYIQELGELSLGFYAPNSIATLYMRNRSFTWRTRSGEAVDSLSAFGFETDIFEKNAPYRIVLDFGYQEGARVFQEETTTTHRYGSLVLGAKLFVELFTSLTLLVDLESSMYTFGRDALLGEVSSDRFLFRLRTGASYRFRW